jgi:hypothetical protein
LRSGAGLRLEHLADMREMTMPRMQPLRLKQ